MKKNNSKVVKILLATLFFLSFHDFIFEQNIYLISQQNEISIQDTSKVMQSLLVEHNLCHSPFILLTNSFITDNQLSTSTIQAKAFFIKQLQSSDIFTPPKTIS
ncbi:hypothetical protein [Sulfurimonas sp. CS5]|uniref:hypothetical protein n=1 Tax=Sulfurimonas sp. CS5 TaxID=3391145 RepID=UPI0039E83D19